jgi:hypothetical protein
MFSQRPWCTNIGTLRVMNLTASERRTIGEEIKTVQFGWPLGMPLVRKLAKDLWEVRVYLIDRIAGVLFAVVGHTMVRGGGDELLGIDIQPFRDSRRLARNVSALVLTDHPAGGVHQFQIVVEGNGDRGGHAAGGIEGHQRCAGQSRCRR